MIQPDTASGAARVETIASKEGRLGDVIRLSLVALGYFFAAALGLELAVVGDSVTPLWPPTGLALVALLAYGYRVWPAVAVAAFAVNAIVGPSVSSAAGIAVGNTLAPVVAAYLLTRVGFRPQLDRVRDALAILFLAAFCMVISATLGSTTLVVADEITGHEFLETWWVWWTGDAMGVLIVAPFLWSLAAFRRSSWSEIDRRRGLEVVALFALLLGATLFAAASHRPMLFIVLPLLGWIAWRFQQRGAAPAGLLVSVIVIWAAVHDDGPFADESLLNQMVVLQTFNAAVAFTSFFFASAVAQRQQLAEHQHRVGETLQRSLLPERLPSAANVAVAARYLPASADVEVGGDWYDVIPLADDRLAVVIGDVAGHGVGAAATMGQIRMALRTYALEDLSPATTLARLNHVIRELQPNAMATVLYAHFDPATRHLIFASAGHLPPLVIQAQGFARYLDGGRSAPVGVSDDVEFREAAVVLDPGATLVLYTDGLIEKRTEMIDERLRLLQRLAADAPDDLDELCDHLVHTLLDHGPADDVALLALRPLPVDPRRLYLRTPAAAEAIASTRHALQSWLTDHEVDEGRVFELLVAATEAQANAVQHAYGLAKGMVEVDATIDETEIVITVRDHGTWRAATMTPRSGGRGVLLMRQLMDSVDVASTPNGTQVRMTRRLAAPA